MTQANVLFTLTLGLTNRLLALRGNAKCVGMPHAALGSCQTKKSAMSMPAASGPHCVYIRASWVEACRIRSSISYGGCRGSFKILAVCLEHSYGDVRYYQSLRELWEDHSRSSVQFYPHSWRLVPEVSATDKTLRRPLRHWTSSFTEISQNANFLLHSFALSKC